MPRPSRTARHPRPNRDRRGNPDDQRGEDRSAVRFLRTRRSARIAESATGTSIRTSSTRPAILNRPGQIDVNDGLNVGSIDTHSESVRRADDAGLARPEAVAVER